MTISNLYYILLGLLSAIILFITLTYLIFPFIVPKKTPKKTPKEMGIIIKKLNKKRLNDLEFSKKVYEIVNKKYSSINTDFIRHPFRVFKNNIFSIWNTEGFQPCGNQNYIFKVILIKSSRFSEKDFKTRYNTHYIIWPHQYYKVRIKNKWYDIDLWGADHKIKFGKHFGI